jgi:hypothetical protein
MGFCLSGNGQTEDLPSPPYHGAELSLNLTCVTTVSTWILPPLCQHGRAGSELGDVAAQCNSHLNTGNVRLCRIPVCATSNRCNYDNRTVVSMGYSKGAHYPECD